MGQRVRSARFAHGLLVILRSSQPLPPAPTRSPPPAALAPPPPPCSPPPPPPAPGPVAGPHASRRRQRAQHRAVHRPARRTHRMRPQRQTHVPQRLRQPPAAHAAGRGRPSPKTYHAGALTERRFARSMVESAGVRQGGRRKGRRLLFGGLVAPVGARKGRKPYSLDASS
jgi:hypothetical protein